MGLCSSVIWLETDASYAPNAATNRLCSSVIWLETDARALLDVRDGLLCGSVIRLEAGADRIFLFFNAGKCPAFNTYHFFVRLKL